MTNSLSSANRPKNYGLEVLEGEKTVEKGEEFEELKEIAQARKMLGQLYQTLMNSPNQLTVEGVLEVFEQSKTLLQTAKAHDKRVALLSRDLKKKSRNVYNKSAEGIAEKSRQGKISGFFSFFKGGNNNFLAEEQQHTFDETKKLNARLEKTVNYIDLTINEIQSPAHNYPGNIFMRLRPADLTLGKYIIPLLDAMIEEINKLFEMQNEMDRWLHSRQSLRVV